MKRGTEVKKGENKIVKLLRQLNINPNLIMLKITLFTMYGATASLLPYLTIHMQSIGLTVDEISMVYLALPLTTFLSPPITGYLIDKFGQYKPVVVLSLVLNAAFHHSLLLIPHMEMPGEMPSAYVIKHPENGRVEVWWSPCPSRECPEEEEWDMVIADCVDHCLLDGATAVTTTTTTTTTAAPVPTVSTELRLNACLRLLNSTQFVETHGQLRNDVTKRKDLHFIFEKDKKSNARPAKRKPTKTHRPATGIDFSQGKGKKKARMGNAAFFLLIMHPDLAEPVENLGIEMEPAESGESLDFAERFGEELLRKARINVSALEEEDLRCGGTVLATNLTNNKLKELADDCMLQKCSFREGGPEVCPPDYKESDDSIFWLYFFLRFVGTVMLSGGVTMLDPIALTMIQKYGGEFGRERLFSTIGMAIFSPLTGLLMDRSSRQLDYTDYSAAFYTYDVLLGISAVTILLMPLGVHLPSDNIMRDLLRIVRLPPVLLFIFFLFTLGNFWGFIESFLFLYLKELGAPNYLLGITVTVGTLSSIPFLYGAGKILRKFGHVNIIIIAFFSHAARLMGYSFIENPWWCFPFEAIESVAVHLMWIAAATYCAVLAPKTLLATLIGVLGMAHFSLGRGSGSFLGGWLLSVVGTRESFRVMGFLAIAGGVLYGLLHYFWLRKVELNSNDLDTTVAAEGAEGHHLNSEADETAAASAERLSMVIEMNNRGSLLSLQDCNHHDSYGIKTCSPPRPALEVHHQRASNPQGYYKDTLSGIPRQSNITSKRVEIERSIVSGENKPCLCHLEGQPHNVHREAVYKVRGHPHRQST